jgi:hypothetical protein
MTYIILGEAQMKTKTNEFYDNGAVKLQKVIETIEYCECGQAVRFRKRDGVYVHTGFKKGMDTYAYFLEMTNHPVVIKEKKDWVEWVVVGDSEKKEVSS